LLSETPALRCEQLLTGERQVLKREKSALIDAMRAGVVSDDVGERLVEEVDVKLDMVRDGRSTVEGDREGYEELWRSRAAAYGLDAAERSDAPDGSAAGSDHDRDR